MLLVNNAAVDTATPPQLMHAGWNLGLHLADLVFPWFIFCVGVSIPFSTGSFFEKGSSGLRYLLKVVQRSVLLIGLGMFIDCATQKHLELSMGILQLIGFAYFIAAIVYTGPAWFRPLAASLLLGGYAAAIMNVSFPGGGAGLFEENRNLIRYYDVKNLVPYNMDGLLSAIPAAGLVLFGTMMGDVLRNRTWQQWMKLVVIALSGLIFLLAGDLLSVFVAYNKPVLTPSYMMVAGGSGAIALACFFLVVDLMKLQKLAFPLVVLGANAIAAYVLPILLKIMVLQVWVIHTPKGNLALQEAFMGWLKLKYGLIDGGWAYTATYIGVWWIVLAAMYRKRVFLKV
jgi:predicted acyltransferase